MSGCTPGADCTHTAAGGYTYSSVNGIWTLPSRPADAQWIRVKCPSPNCGASIEYARPEPQALKSHVGPMQSSFQVRCCSCGANFEPPGASARVREARSTQDKGHSRCKSGTTKDATKRRRKIGTDDNPLDMTYYEVMGIGVKATDDEIRRAYRKRAIQLHPDKRPGDAQAAEQFKELATAYHVLKDPELRHRYNEFGTAQAGASGGPDGSGAIDPEEVFGQLFGGERFKDIIGTLSIVADMKQAMQSEELEQDSNEAIAAAQQAAISAGQDPEAAKKEAEACIKTAKEERDRKMAAERAAARETRVNELAESLIAKLNVYTEAMRGADDPVHQQAISDSFEKIEAEKALLLRDENFGVDLLHAVGGQYTAKSKHYLASVGVWGALGGMFHGATSGVHTLRETMSTVRAALDLKRVYEEISKAETEGITEVRKQELEQEAAAKLTNALFKGAKLEVENVIREVAEKVLYDPAVTKETQRLRAQALGILGDVYSSVVQPSADDPTGKEKPDPAGPGR